MELFISIWHSVSEYFWKFLSWLVGKMIKEAADYLRKKFLFSSQKISISNANIEFYFDDLHNSVEIYYELTNNNPYSFKIVTIQGILKVFTREITTINRLYVEPVKRNEKVSIRIKTTLNEFESNLIKSLKKDLVSMHTEFYITHLISYKEDLLTFTNSIKDEKALIIK